MRRNGLWTAAAVLLAIAGVAGAWLAASEVARSDAARERTTFKASSREVASALRLSLLHEEDLVVSAQAFFAERPDAISTDLTRWLGAVRAFERYPELQGLGYAQLLRPAEVPSFAARMRKELGASALPGGKLRIMPPGRRPFYCLAPANRTRDGSLPLGIDYCAADPKSALMSRDTGESVVDERDGVLLTVFVPIYRRTAGPQTVAARRAAFVGWAALVSTPKLVLDRALAGHPRMTASMSLRQPGSRVEFSSGAPPKGAASASQALRDGWTLHTFKALPASGVLSNGEALAVLASGIAASVLLAALVFVLGTGRARALRLVEEKTDELRYQALHDALTGLPNRALVTDRAEQLLTRNRRMGTVPAAMFIDLDGFKDVNDTLGHDAGDELLRAVAQRLKTCLRESDTVARMGGDEFVVLVDGGPGVAPELVAERMLSVLREPFTLTGAPMSVTVTASIGIATGDRASAGELLRDADVAMYRAKSAGKDGFELFRPELHTDVRKRFEMEAELRAGLEREQFRLVYQPIYNLDDFGVVGVEALLRWTHPTLGSLQPDDFIPLLESSGQIVEVGRFVLIEACRQTADWHARGSELGISVNVSARQLDSDLVVDHVREALALSELGPSHLTLEITETALMTHPEGTARRLRELKEVGVQIAIDDFGTGYSSLAYLQQFPVDSLKIDRAFTSGISRSRESEALIHTLVQLGRDLGLRTLAEGVETTAQVDHLRGEDVQEAQGFLLARPLEAEAFETKILGLGGRVSQSDGAGARE